MRHAQTLAPIVWIGLLIGIWELSSQTGIVNPYILPPFSSVIQTLIEESTTGTLLLQALNSLWIIILGFIISLVIALIVSIAGVRFKVVDSFVSTLCAIFNPLPGIVLIPLLMMWFGIGNGILVALIVHSIVWPLITNWTTGFRAIPAVYIEWGRNIELNTFQIVKDISLYAVMPYTLSGLIVGWGRAWRALIAAEMIFGMIGSIGGIGQYVYMARVYANTEQVLAGILIVVIIGLFVEGFLFKKLEKVTIQKWGMSRAEV